MTSMQLNWTSNQHHSSYHLDLILQYLASSPCLLPLHPVLVGYTGIKKNFRWPHRPCDPGPGPERQRPAFRLFRFLVGGLSSSPFLNIAWMLLRKRQNDAKWIQQKLTWTIKQYTVSLVWIFFNTQYCPIYYARYQRSIKVLSCTQAGARRPRCVLIVGASVAVASWPCDGCSSNIKIRTVHDSYQTISPLRWYGYKTDVSTYYVDCSSDINKCS